MGTFLVLRIFRDMVSNQNWNLALYRGATSPSCLLTGAPDAVDSRCQRCGPEKSLDLLHACGKRFFFKGKVGRASDDVGIA